MTQVTDGWVFRNFATFRAFSECLCCLRGSVSSPWRKRKALNGLMHEPRSRSSWTLALMMNATLPSPGKLPKTSQNFRPW